MANAATVMQAISLLVMAMLVADGRLDGRGWTYLMLRCGLMLRGDIQVEFAIGTHRCLCKLQREQN